MRGNTPPTTRSPPHRSRPAGNPPNRQPATVGKEERGRRGPTSRRTLDEGGPRSQAATDRALCAAAPHQHQSPPPTTRRSPQRAASRHGEGGQRRRRTATQRHTAVGGPRPGPATAATRPATATLHATLPANNNRMEERRMSCRQQPAPPPSDAAKMSPRTSICPDSVLASHAPSPPTAGRHCPMREGSAPHLRNRVFCNCPFEIPSHPCSQFLIHIYMCVHSDLWAFPLV